MKEALFMGKITATATHELKNVLAIIRESGGLMQDFLDMVNDGSFKYKEKFGAILSKVEDQVRRGDEISTQLNRFAHIPDSDSSSENVPEVIDQIIALTHRIARSRDVSFVSRPHQGMLLLTCDPVKTRMLLFQAMELLMKNAKRGEKIEIRSRLNDNKKTVIEFCMESDRGSSQSLDHLLSSGEWEDLVATAGAISSKAAFSSDSGILSLELVNPDYK